MYGGTYMLAKPDVKVNFDESGNAVSVSSEGETVKPSIVVGDPSAQPDTTPLELTTPIISMVLHLSYTHDRTLL